MRKDICFSFKKHPLTGDLIVKTGSNAIRQSIINLVTSNFSDRGFNVEAAVNIDASLFEIVTNLEANALRANIRSVIENFEPDVELIDVEVYSNGDHDLQVRIIYTEYASTEERSVVVSMSRVR